MDKLTGGRTYHSDIVALLNLQILEQGTGTYIETFIDFKNEIFVSI